MALVYLLFVVAIFYWQFSAVRAGKVSKLKALGRYVGYSIAPVVLFGVGFVGLVGVEELTGGAFIGEGYARSLPFVIAGGSAVVMLTSLLFALLAWLIKPKQDGDR
ncbi:MAG: hypothetical protein V7752_11845 [Halopseudomonas sp.]